MAKGMSRSPLADHGGLYRFVNRLLHMGFVQMVTPVGLQLRHPGQLNRRKELLPAELPMRLAVLFGQQARQKHPGCRIAQIRPEHLSDLLQLIL